jgi:hypothetical protein
VLAALLSKDIGTDPERYFAVAATLIVAGFVIGIIGHLTRTKTLVALGIALVFLASVLLPLYGQLGR